MPIKAKCGSCGASLNVPDMLAGKTARCPKCKAVIPVHAAESSSTWQRESESEPRRQSRPSGTKQSRPVVANPTMPGTNADARSNQSGATRILLIVFGVVGGIVIVSCLGIGGCVFLVGRGARNVAIGVSDDIEQARIAAEERKARERKQDQDEKSKALNVRLDHLVDEYRENEVAADLKYKGKWLRIQGLVDHISSAGVISDITVTLNGEKFGRSVLCSFDDAFTREAAALKRGQTITVIGKCNGKFLSVSFKQCELIGQSIESSGKNNASRERPARSGAPSTPKPSVITDDWSDVGAEARVGDVSIELVWARIRLIGGVDRFQGGGITIKDQMVVKLKLSNRSTTKTVNFSGWDGITLKDEIDNKYGEIALPPEFSFNGVPPDKDRSNECGLQSHILTAADTFYPQKCYIRYLLFQRTVGAAHEVRLELPADALGGEGMIRLRAPIGGPSEEWERKQSTNYWIKALIGSDDNGVAKARDRLIELGVNAVPDLRKVLSNEDGKVRLAAISILGAIGENAIDAGGDLANLLGDSEPTIRTAAAKALGQIGKGAREHVIRLIRATNDPNPAVHAAVVDALPKIGVDKAHAFKLLILWQEPDAIQRANYVALTRALKPDSETAAILFLPLLKDRERSIREIAIQAIGAVGRTIRDQAFPHLLGLLDDPDPQMRVAAQSAIVKTGPPKPSERADLDAALSSKSVEKRATCALQLGLLGKDAGPSIPMITKLLKDMEPTVRAAAASALGHIGPSEAWVINDLLNARLDSEGTVRREVIAALASVGREPGVLKGLFDALSDSDTEVRAAAEKAIRVIKPPLGKRDLALLTEHLKDKKVESRRFCAAELARIGPDAQSVFTDVLAAMKDTDPEVRGQLFAAAGNLGAEAIPATPILIEAVNTIAKSDAADKETRQLFHQASAALVRVAQPAEAAPVFLTAIKTKNKALRSDIVQALLAIGEPARKAVPDLCTLLGDEDVSQLAGDTLLKLRGPDVVKELARVVEKGPLPAKMEAIRFLGKMGREAIPAYSTLNETYRAHRGEALGKAALDAMRLIGMK